MEWDVFISHASEDKDFVRDLVDALEESGLRIWFDETILNVGDSLRRCIDQGLSKSEYGIVVLSNNFFAKEWPKKELDGLVAREDGREKVIIPIWHNVTVDEVRRFSPLLSDKLSINSNQPTTLLVERILRAIYQDRIVSKGWVPPIQVLPDETELVFLPIRPRFEVALGISKHPITNWQYKRFLYETGYTRPVGKFFRDGAWKGPFEPLVNPDFNHPKQPIVCVSFRDAITYCQWVNKALDYPKTGFRDWGNWVFLPTTQLWDFAAWGARPSDQRSAKFVLSEQPGIHHNANSPTVINDSGIRANARGISDMFGNIWEWCSDYFDHRISLFRPFRRRADVELRGGGFLDDILKIKPYLRASMLQDGTKTRHTDLGFRVAALIPLTYLPKDIQVKLSLQQQYPTEFWDSCVSALRYPFYDGEDN